MPVVMWRSKSREKLRSPRSPPRSPPRRLSLRTKMAMETEMERCREHSGAEIVMFCQTCEELLCTKCICQGPRSTGKHKEHVCLDLVEASTIYKGDIENVINKLRDSLEQKKELRLLSQRRLQNIKFDLLRKRTFVERRKRSLLDRIQKDDARFQNSLESLVSDHLGAETSRFRELDYSVVSQEGLLCSLQSLAKLEGHDQVSFIKNFVKAKQEVLKISDNITDSPADITTDVSEECELIRKVNLTLASEKELIGRALEMPTEVPRRPKLLQSWCVIGSNGASLVWKQDMSTKVDKFHVYYYPANSVQRSLLRRLSGAGTTDYEYKYGKSCIKVIIRCTAKRCQAVLRHLKTNTEYDVLVCAVNCLGESEAEKASFKTGEGPVSSESSKVQTDKDRPMFRLSLEDIMNSTIALLAVSAFIFCLLYVLGATFEGRLCERLATENGLQVLQAVCPTEYQAMVTREREAQQATVDRRLYDGYNSSEAIDILQVIWQFFSSG